MHQIPTANNQDPFFPKRSELSADFEVEEGRLPLVDAQLYHRNIGLRKCVAEHRPGSMIETPRLIELHPQRRKHFRDATSKIGVAGRRIPDLIEFSRKSSEIVNCPRCSAYRNARLWYKPMSGDRQNGSRPGRPLPDAPPSLCIGVVQDRIHWIAVTKKDRGHYCIHRQALTVPRACCLFVFTDN